MAIDKQASNAVEAVTNEVTVKIRGRGQKVHNVKFGNVVVSGTKPSRQLVRENVERSTEALERVRKKFAKPGVYLRFRTGVPSYYADEDEPSFFFRVLNGKTQRGQLINGKFQAQS